MKETNKKPHGKLTKTFQHSQRFVNQKNMNICERTVKILQK